MKRGPGTSLRCRWIVVVAVAMVIAVVLSLFVSAPSDGVAGGVLSLELEAQAGAGQVGPQRAPNRRQRAVEEQVLDPVVVVEILQVAETRQGAAGVGVQRGRAVGRQRQRAGLAEGAGAQEPGDPAQRVASAWSTSTAPASSIRRK